MDFTHETCLMATAKDEAPWLLEWVAHNVAIGFDRIVVGTNDCTDGTDEMLDRLAELGVVRHVVNHRPFKPYGLQVSAYERARRFPEVACSRWLMNLDLDEFLNVKTGDHGVRDLIAAVPDEFDAVLVCWRVFGDGGTSGWIEGPLTEALTRAASVETNTNLIKTLMRRHHEMPKFAMHGPSFDGSLEPDEVRPAVRGCLVNGKAIHRREFPGRGRSFFRSPVPGAGWDIAQVNHYMVKNRELFELKRRRGAASLNGGDAREGRHNDEMFAQYNRNDCEDTSIRATADRRLGLLEEYLRDPVLGPLHRRAVDAARAVADAAAAAANPSDSALSA